METKVFHGITHYPYTLTFTCGHREQRYAAPAQTDRTSFGLCPKCDAKRDRVCNKICRDLTGAVPDDQTVLRWRLRATPDEVRAALAAVDGWEPRMVHDDGTDQGRELRYHGATLAMLADKARGRRCGCGCGASWDHTVSGTAGLKAAVWAGCPIHRGSAVSLPVVGPEEIGRLTAARESAERLGMDLDDMIEAAAAAR